MTVQLKKSLPQGSTVTEEALAKYSMGDIIRKHLWSLSGREVFGRIEEDQEIQKLSQKKN
jgi:hypothetical protein